VKVGLWLPVSYAVWYFSSILSVVPLAEALDVLAGWVFPTLIDEIAPDGNKLLVTTSLTVENPDPSSTAVGIIRFKPNPLDYGYCLPLYTALVLASPGDLSRKVVRWTIGAAILFFVQLFGVSTMIMNTLVYDLNEHTRELLGLSTFGYALMDVAYKLGFLILPPVAPLLIWISQFRPFVVNITRAGRREESSPSSRS
jgi:hypothetical protein